ncbi:MAG: alanine--tRNA ligase, partial [Nitrospirae bacterium]
PTLLFTNAGMVQFKSIFLGKERPIHKRVVTIQKCLRAGGKHNDLENVGRTARHHTFFEMLGNFSFGDYFKEEAIIWAWEFLTDWAKLPAERLWVSVYEDDEEALELWIKNTDIQRDRVVKLGEEDNFWQMGETGPCGPCSEIIIDQGEDIGCGRADCSVGCSCDRYLELWNLVFMQYNRDENGYLSPLPKPSIDTGMGLERLAAVLQKKHDNFESDLFMPIIKKIEELTGINYGKNSENDISIKVIADHIRAATFTISEGLVPSNEGRGYVLRRIIRRAARHGFMLGIEEPFLHKLVDTVVGLMAVDYSELKDYVNSVKRVLEAEEKRFELTLSQGMNIVNEIIEDLRSSGVDTIPGEDMFRLYDTFGFPIDLLEDIAKEKGLKLDYKGFEQYMQLQKSRAKADQSRRLEKDKDDVYRKISKHIKPTVFIGYETYETKGAKILSIIKDHTVVDSAEEGDSVEIILDKT